MNLVLGYIWRQGRLELRVSSPAPCFLGKRQAHNQSWGKGHCPTKTLPRNSNLKQCSKKAGNGRSRSIPVAMSSRDQLISAPWSPGTALILVCLFHLSLWHCCGCPLCFHSPKLVFTASKKDAPDPATSRRPPNVCPNDKDFLCVNCVPDNVLGAGLHHRVLTELCLTATSSDFLWANLLAFRALSSLSPRQPETPDRTQQVSHKGERGWRDDLRGLCFPWAFSLLFCLFFYVCNM